MRVQWEKEFRTLLGWALLIVIVLLHVYALLVSRSRADEPALARAAGVAWPVTRPAWSAGDEREYSDFVRTLGEARCNTVAACFKSSANPFRASDPPGTSIYADCADLPYVLRAYFAWKKGLPFSYVIDVEARGGAGPSGDIRYSPDGNRAIERRTISGASDALKAISALVDNVSSAMLRIGSDSGGGSDPWLFQDFYSVGVDRKSVIPGTVIYDPAGHVAVVYHVDSGGRVHYIDAHPDGSLTRGVYGRKFARSPIGQGAGFKSFRPLKSSGSRVQGALDRELPLFSIEQQIGNAPGGRFEHAGQLVDYYDWVRYRLAEGELRYDPLQELASMIEALCQDLRDRVASVDAAIRDGIDARPHPERLPSNIYGTSGEWENYSTPSRDARLKTSFKEMRDRVEEFVRLYQAQSPRVIYAGTDLKRDLLRVLTDSGRACALAYRKSDGRTQALGFEELSRRLFALSFDPYHCPELRWGAEGVELGSCRDDSLKRRWYEGEQRLRNQIERRYDAATAFDVDEIFQALPGNGPASPPDVDLRRYLQR